MVRSISALFRFTIATALVCGALLASAPGQTASISKADKIALKQAIVACKAEARGNKVKWLARRKYVNRCVVEALKDHPNIDAIQLLKNHPDMKDLPPDQWDTF